MANVERLRAFVKDWRARISNDAEVSGVHRRQSFGRGQGSARGAPPRRRPSSYCRRGFRAAGGDRAPVQKCLSTRLPSSRRGSYAALVQHRLSMRVPSRRIPHGKVAATRKTVTALNEKLEALTTSPHIDLLAAQIAQTRSQTVRSPGRLHAQQNEQVRAAEDLKADVQS